MDTRWDPNEKETRHDATEEELVAGAAGRDAGGVDGWQTQAAQAGAGRSGGPAVAAAPATPVPAWKLDRTSLPILEPSYPPITELDVRKATPPPRFEVKPPEGAPNVLVILIDDMGFGIPSAFGGPVHMPTADRLAQSGLRYNAFHNTAVCSPTRTALLNGRNHHSNNMAGITETATAFPGNTGQRPNSVAPLAEMLRLNGYSTAAYGKSHETAPWETSPSGDRPTAGRPAPASTSSTGSSAVRPTSGRPASTTA